MRDLQKLNKGNVISYLAVWDFYRACDLIHIISLSLSLDYYINNKLEKARKRKKKWLHNVYLFHNCRLGQLWIQHEWQCSPSKMDWKRRKQFIGKISKHFRQILLSSEMMPPGGFVGRFTSLLPPYLFFPTE